MKHFWTPEARKIIRVYHYMYRFSVDLLNKFKKDEALMCLFEHYILHHLQGRMRENKPMMKHVDAYNEAVQRMLQKFDHPKQSSEFNRCANLDDDDDDGYTSSEEIEANTNQNQRN